MFSLSNIRLSTYTAPTVYRIFDTTVMKILSKLKLNENIPDMHITLLYMQKEGLI